MTGIAVGSVQVLPLSDGTFARPVTRFFPDVPATAWAAHAAEHLEADGTSRINVGCFLLRADGRTLLVDTGLGPGVDLGGPSGMLLDEIAAAGVAPDEVDAVLTTHLHFDHVGWNTVEREGAVVPTFPRARYYLQRAEWEFWTSPERDPSLTRHIDVKARPLAAAGVLEPVDGEHAVTASVRFLPTPGHTPGHASILIDSGGEQAVILGDVAHSPAQVVQPEWSVGADLDKELGQATRRVLWDRIEQHGLRVCAGHFAPPNIGRFIQVEGKRTWRAL